MTLRILILFLIVKIVSSKTTLVSCPVKWVPAGIGLIEPEAIECSEQIDEFVGRMFHMGRWISGRIVPAEGTIYVPYNGLVIESTTYQVLKIPKQCKIHWVDYKEISSLADHAVIVDQNLQTFVGRSSTHKQTYCGTVNDLLGGGNIELPTDENTVETHHHRFQILVSVYPPLEIHLRDFIFDISNVNKANTVTRIIGQIDARVPATPMPFPSLSLDFHHSKSVKETFLFKEDTLNWIGVHKVNISFPLFYGSHDFKIRNHIFDEEDIEMLIHRDRTLKITSKYDYTGLQGNTGVRHCQICSLGRFLENVEIPFTCKVIYKGDGLVAEQLEEILQSLGRPFDIPAKATEKYIIGEIRGVLDGKFALYASLVIEDVPNNSQEIICSHLIN